MIAVQHPSLHHKVFEVGVDHDAGADVPVKHVEERLAETVRARAIWHFRDAARRHRAALPLQRLLGSPHREFDS
jgi:hypothetical protein